MSSPHTNELPPYTTADHLANCEDVLDYVENTCDNSTKEADKCSDAINQVVNEACADELARIRTDSIVEALNTWYLAIDMHYTGVYDYGVVFNSAKRRIALDSGWRDWCLRRGTDLIRLKSDVEGSFAQVLHTLHHFLTSRYVPDRLNFDDFDGLWRLEQRARNQARALLTTGGYRHIPPPVIW